MYNIDLNTKTIVLERCHNLLYSKTKQRPHHWRKLLTYVPFINVLPKHSERTLLPYMTENIPCISYQHGFKYKHSAHTAFHNICIKITRGFNNSRPPHHTLAVAFDKSKAFYTINIHKLSNKHSENHHQVHCKLHRSTTAHLETQTNQNWSTIRWSFISNIFNILQHLHLNNYKCLSFSMHLSNRNH